VFTGADWQRDQPIFWEHEGNRAVRMGDWKLVSRFPDDWELYNMIEDRTELNDRAESERQRVQTMVKLYDGWAERCQVASWPLPTH